MENAKPNPNRQNMQNKEIDILTIFISLQNPPKKLFKEIEDLFFISYGTAREIKSNLYKTHARLRTRCKVKMINIRVFIDSMQLTRLKCFISSPGNWTEIARRQLPPGINFLFTAKKN